MTATEPLYKDPSQPVNVRVDDLLARMTLEEKVAQLGGYMSYMLLGPDGPDPAKMSELLGNGIGQISRVGGTLNVPPTTTAAICNSIQQFLREHTRLGIPAMIHEECLAGYESQQATMFPQIIGVAATWEPELVEQMMTIVREQMRAVGVHQGLSPVLDVARDPRWGRVEETFGEDPYLIARMGVAYVRGLQGDDLAHGIVATGKHFLGYGLSEGGLNWAPAHISSRELYEVFARPFEAAIREAGLASVMNAYNELDGVPCGVSREILTDFLRDKLGFSGLVVSDYLTISTAYTYHHAARDMQDAAIQAIRAGLDVELPNVEGYGAPLIEAVRQGKVEESFVDTSARRVLEAKFRLGLFENPFVDTNAIPGVMNKPEGPALSRELAYKSMTLLKNEGGLLPLTKDIRSLAVIGPSADRMRSLLGDYSYVSQMEGVIDILRSGVLTMTGSATADPQMIEKMFGDIATTTDDEALARKLHDFPTVLQAIQSAVSPSTQVHYAQGCDIAGESTDGFAEAVTAAKQADVAILVLGEQSGLSRRSTSGEARDRASLDLPGVQQALLEAVYATGTPVVLVLLNGRPLAVKWAAAHAPAILEAWVPSQEGATAIASVLFGDVNPNGKLPISVPRSVGQIPVYHYHKPSGGRSHWHGEYVDEGTQPLYPFGFGLSYTTFAYDNLRIEPAQVDSGGSVQIACEVRNTGDRVGEEVVQLYLHDREADVTRPVRELAGFKRVTLAPSETCTVTFTVQLSQLGFYNRQMDFVVEPGAIDVMVGSSSADIHLTGEFTITGAPVEVRGQRAFFSDVEVKA
jgi:beta-glucosidase